MDEQFQKWLTGLQEQWAITGVGQLDPDKVESLRAYWSGLSIGQKRSAFQALAQHASGPDTLSHFIEQTVRPAVAKQQTAAAQPTGPPTYPGEPTSYGQTTATGPATSQATPQSSLAAPWPGTRESAALLWGDPNKGQPAYQPFTLAGVDQHDPHAVSSALGLDPTALQAQYRSYQQNIAQAQQRFEATGTLTSWLQHPSRTGPGTVGPMPIEQFAQMQASAQQGQWQPAINMLNYLWRQQTGQDMPPDLVSQVMTAFNTLPDTTKLPLLHQMLTTLQQIESQQKASHDKGIPFDPSALVQGFLGQMANYAPNVYAGSITSGSSVLATYNVAHPTYASLIAGQQGQEVSQAVQMLTQFGVPATPELVKQIMQHGAFYSELSAYLPWMAENKIPVTAENIQRLLGMTFSDPASGYAPPGSGGDWLLNQPSDIKGLTVGVKGRAYNNIRSLWNQYYGKAPSNNDIAWAVGKSTDQIMNHIMDSPSHIDGINIGRYEDLSKFAQNLYTSGSLSYQVTDDLVHNLQHASAPR